MIKWRLMVTTLPYVAAVLVVKLVLQFQVGVQGLVEFGDVGMVFTAGVFLLGFLHYLEDVAYFGREVLPIVRELEAAELERV